MATNTEKNASSAALLTGKRGATIEEKVLHFYQNDQLATEISSKGTRHILWSQDTSIAQLEHSKSTKILQVDHANSVLGMPTDSIAYSPYGHFIAGNSAALVAFNGQRLDLLTNGYALGNGYRTYRPILRRFCSPDTLSPFNIGGLNPYSYCEGDPINSVDPSGHYPLPNVKSWLYRNGPTGDKFFSKTPIGSPSASNRRNLGYASYIAEKAALAPNAKYLPARTQQSRSKELALKSQIKGIEAEIDRNNVTISRFPPNTGAKLEKAHRLVQASEMASERANSTHWHANTNFRNHVLASEAKGSVNHFFNSNPNLRERYELVASTKELINNAESLRQKINRLRQH
ncbi:RHS repeat-associated core domain-containing protein [Pseudomonas inefficax]|uniref:RHS repeat-associated core domain-containing protein n=1 Tax=Pseudomonas inefficax TaxID=2078786 RepID=UPI004046D56A